MRQFKEYYSRSNSCDGEFLNRRREIQVGHNGRRMRPGPWRRTGGLLRTSVDFPNRPVALCQKILNVVLLKVQVVLVTRHASLPPASNPAQRTESSIRKCLKSLYADKHFFGDTTGICTSIKTSVGGSSEIEIVTLPSTNFDPLKPYSRTRNPIQLDKGWYQSDPSYEREDLPVNRWAVCHLHSPKG